MAAGVLVTSPGRGFDYLGKEVLPVHEEIIELPAPSLLINCDMYANQIYVRFLFYMLVLICRGCTFNLVR